MLKRMNVFGFTNADLAVVAWSFTTISVTQLNLILGAFTGIAGLGIQLYFKLQQNKRDAEKHEWEKNEHKQNQN